MINVELTKVAKLSSLKPSTFVAVRERLFRIFSVSPRVALQKRKNIRKSLLMLALTTGLEPVFSP
jgi:hypothetical protein